MEVDVDFQVVVSSRCICVLSCICHLPTQRPQFNSLYPIKEWRNWSSDMIDVNGGGVNLIFEWIIFSTSQYSTCTSKKKEKDILIFNVSTRIHLQILTLFDGKMREIFDATEMGGVGPWVNYSASIFQLYISNPDPRWMTLIWDIPHLEVLCGLLNISYILKQYGNDFTYIVTSPF